MGELEAGRLVPAGRCANCFAPWDQPGLNCTLCAGWGMTLDGCRAAFEMRGPARSLVLRLKFNGIRELAREMSPRLEPLWDSRYDGAVAVPLHWKRQNERGFNQAELLLAPLGWPGIPGRLERVRNTAHQVGRDAGERRRGMTDAFRYSGGDLTGMNIALVDDVVTTGATAIECAKALRDGGARSVTVLAFARANRMEQAPSPLLLD